MKYEFGSCSYRNSQEMHVACAGEWLTAGGLNSQEYVLEALRDCSAEDMARELFEGWSSLLDVVDEDGDQVWSVEKMTDIFQDMKNNPEKHFPAEAA
jgi:hypothetical protein